jgi:hypothetical protein
MLTRCRANPGRRCRHWRNVRKNVRRMIDSNIRLITDIYPAAQVRIPLVAGAVVSAVASAAA